jgi:hypothetical protein
MFSARFHRDYTWKENSKNVAVCSLMLGIPVSEFVFDVMSFNEQAKHTTSINPDDRCVLGCDMFADIRSNLSPPGASSLIRNVDRSVAGTTLSRRWRLWWLRAGWSGAWIPVGAKFFRTRPDRPRGPPSLLYIGYCGFFPWVRRPGRGVNHPPYLAPSFKRVELCLYSRLCHYGMLLDDLYLYRSEKVRFLLSQFCVTYSRRISDW